MPHEILVPRLGWSMEEGTFLGWLKQDGDVVQLGEALFELEGEKAVQEIEALDAGTLHIPPDAPQPGTVLAVGALLGYVLAEGETLPAIPAPANTNGADTADGRADSPLSNHFSAPTVDPSAAPPAAPSVRRLARELNVSLSSVTGTGVAGRITADDVRAQSRPPLPSRSVARKSSPRARRLAQELGIDWTRLDGTGERGRVREADVRRAAESSPNHDSQSLREPPSLSRTNTPADADGSSQPTIQTLSSRRRVIADRMRLSHERTVPVTLSAVADASNLVSLRNQFKQAETSVPVPAYTDFAACLAAAVLRRHRVLAARWDEGQTTLRLPADDGFHIGVAVDSPDGLLVPVLRDVGRSSLADVAFRSRTLIEQARSGTLSSAQMQDGVFTITSLGAFGIDAFTPVINYPEIAILGIGAIRREAVVLDGERLAAADRMTLSLTFDHRAVDGAPAAAFLRDFRLALENPAPHLLGL